MIEGLYYVILKNLKNFSLLLWSTVFTSKYLGPFLSV